MFPFDSFARAVESLTALSGRLRQRLSPREADATEKVLAMVIGALREDVTQALTTATDRAYGQGHREGREVGATEGWTRRDAQEQEERRLLEQQVTELRPYAQAYRAMLDAQAPTVPAPGDERDAICDRLLSALDSRLTNGTAKTH